MPIFLTHQKDNQRSKEFLKITRTKLWSLITCRGTTERAGTKLFLMFYFTQASSLASWNQNGNCENNRHE